MRNGPQVRLQYKKEEKKKKKKKTEKATKKERKKLSQTHEPGKSN